MPRRALFLCPALDAGGAERHWETLIPALVARDIDVRVVAVEGGGRALETLREAGIPVEELGGKGLGSLTRFRALRRQRSFQPDVVVTWGYNAHVLGALFARTTRTPQVLSWHRGPGLPATRLQLAAVRTAGLAGAGAIAVSQTQVPELKKFGIRDERIRVIPNGTPSPRTFGEPRAEHRRAQGIPEDAFVAVIVARLRPEKNVEHFIEAMRRVQETVPGAIGIVVGDGPLRAGLAARAQECGADVRFVGYSPEPWRYMLASDVVCLSGDFEALPMSLIEAAACGRPCVATDVGGTSEIVRHGSTGLLVRPRDPRALAEAIRELALDERLRRSMGDAARRHWKATFSFDVMVHRYVRLLTTAAGPPLVWHESETSM
jgi:glycosyltransferase involved in cell wall biosynthesis